MGLFSPAWQSKKVSKQGAARREVETMHKRGDFAGLIQVMLNAPQPVIRGAAADYCRDKAALIKVALNDQEFFGVRSAALNSLWKCKDPSCVDSIVPLTQDSNYILAALETIHMLDGTWVEKNGTAEMLPLIAAAKAAGNAYSHWADGFTEVIVKALAMDKDEPAKAADLPDNPDADALIDYIVAHRSPEEALPLFTRLTAILQDQFYSNPAAVEKAIHTFGNSEMTARYRMIRNTMQPGDLGLLMPELAKNYIMRYR